MAVKAVKEVTLYDVRTQPKLSTLDLALIAQKVFPETLVVLPLQGGGYETTGSRVAAHFHASNRNQIVIEED